MIRVSSRRYFAAVRWILAAQLLGVVCVAFGFAVFQGRWAAYSAALGGLTAFIPTLAFAMGLGVRDDRRTARQVVRLLYGGEALRLGLTAALFALVFQVPLIQPLPVMGGFLVVLSGFWFALIAVRTNR